MGKQELPTTASPDGSGLIPKPFTHDTGFSSSRLCPKNTEIDPNGFHSPAIQAHMIAVLRASQTMYYYLNIVEPRDRIDLPEGVVPTAEEFKAGVFSPREHQVVYGLASGLTNHEIAASLSIGDQTVKNHVTSILQNTGTHTRAEAIMKCIAMGSVNPELLTPIDPSALKGFAELSDSEHNIVRLLTTSGRSPNNREIAEALFITEQTVKNHMTAVLRKLQLDNRTEVQLASLQRKAFIRTNRGNPPDSTLQEARSAIAILLAGPGTITQRTDAYRTLHARHQAEALAHAVQWGLYPADTKALIQRKALLTPDEISLLDRCISFKDDKFNIDSQLQAIARNLIRDEITQPYLTANALRTKLTEIRGKLGVNTNFIAAVIGQLALIDEPHPTGWLAQADEWNALLLKNLAAKGITIQNGHAVLS